MDSAAARSTSAGSTPIAGASSRPSRATRAHLAAWVGHDDETRLKGPVHVLDRAILLVALHGLDQHLRRDFQEALVELAQQGLRPFDQGRDLVEQLRIDARAQSVGSRETHDLLADALAPKLEGRLDPALFAQGRGIVRRLTDGDRRRVMETVASGAGLGGQTHDKAFDGFGAE